MDYSTQKLGERSIFLVYNFTKTNVLLYALFEHLSKLVSLVYEAVITYAKILTVSWS